MTKSFCCLYDRLKIDSSQFGDRWSGNRGSVIGTGYAKGCIDALTVLASAFTSHCVSMKLKWSDQKRNTTASGRC